MSAKKAEDKRSDMQRHVHAVCEIHADRFRRTAARAALRTCWTGSAKGLSKQEWRKAGRSSRYAFAEDITIATRRRKRRTVVVPSQDDLEDVAQEALLHIMQLNGAGVPCFRCAHLQRGPGGEYSCPLRHSDLSVQCRLWGLIKLRSFDAARKLLLQRQASRPGTEVVDDYTDSDDGLLSIEFLSVCAQELSSIEAALWHDAFPYKPTATDYMETYNCSRATAYRRLQSALKKLQTACGFLA